MPHRQRTVQGSAGIMARDGGVGHQASARHTPRDTLMCRRARAPGRRCAAVEPLLLLSPPPPPPPPHTPTPLPAPRRAENVKKGEGMANPWPFRADLLGALKALQPA